MTTKELLRRLESFSSLDYAAHLFTTCENKRNPFVFRVVKDGVVSYTSYHFVEIQEDSRYISIERFSAAVFNVQVSYFKSFFNRASKTQQDYIRSSMLVNNLLSLCKL